ncbi:MAG TPA: hypothetical protein VEV42_18610 [Pyrinomonadaceae bacterium]|jgi:cytoskeletal protein RodZ|nr:hypothetical protein [Pyrinomonadaceae bacterium]
MKKCPECEFLYEDEQSLCDMDGALLVLDSRTLPNQHALATVPAIPVQQRRSRAVPAFATLVLALVLGSVYYVSTQRHAYSPAPETSTSANPASVESVAPVESVALPAPEAKPSESPREEVKEEAKPAAKQLPATHAKQPAVKAAPSPQTAKPASEPKKEDSKVGSILKKTGRILKKPFKF